MDHRGAGEANREIEFEIGILAALVADLDKKDDNVLGAISTFLQRMGGNLGLGDECQTAIATALTAIEGVISHNEDFDEAYKSITKAVDLLSEKTAPDVGETASEGPGFDAGNPELVDFLHETDEYLGSAEAALLELEKYPHQKDHIDEVFRCFHNIKGIAGFLALEDFEELSHAAEWLMDSVRSGVVELSGSYAQAVFDAVDMLRNMLTSVKRAMGGETYRIPDALPILVARLHRLSEEQASGASSENRPATATSPVEGPAYSQPKISDDVMRVATRRLDALIDSVGELVIANGMVQQEVGLQANANSRLGANVQRLGKIVRELQEQATGLRMVSLESTFRKLARVVRDLSTKSSAPVDFTFEGEDTELDRSVVDEMQSPLVHMIRNAVDHGIESPDDRVRVGKAKAGRVHVSASHKGGNVFVQIRDDGRGLDKQAIFAKAVDRGLAKPGAEIDDKEIYKLILEPGFSTNDKVTEVSGRGVGMDVVKRSLDKLRGRIEIASNPGEGTAFSIYLPLTMAVIDGMVITVGSQHMVVPSIAIHESLRPVKDQIHTVQGKGEMVLIRGSLLPMFRLHHLFSIPNARLEPSEALILVITDGERPCALLVDDLLGQQQVVVKPIGSLFSQVPAVSGASIMGDGSVALILDTAGILRMAREVSGT